MPDPHDWESDDEARQREALRHSMFNTELPGYPLYEGRLSPWWLFGLLAATIALAVLTIIVLRPEVHGPDNRIAVDGLCHRVSRDGEPPSADPVLVAVVFDACYADVFDGDLLVAPIDAPTYRFAAAFLVSDPVEFDRIVSTEPYVLDDLGGGLYVVRTGTDVLPRVHVRGGRGPWTCPLHVDAAPCTSP
ncbi:MAG: hypothetical protein HY828_12435 [Actinobacteria bacterium]|nr:hypothetical protein [Actinomycetota bacterium]